MNQMIRRWLFNSLEQARAFAEDVAERHSADVSAVTVGGQYVYVTAVAEAMPRLNDLATYHHERIAS